jgi:hypothetical protein
LSRRGKSFEEGDWLRSRCRTPRDGFCKQDWRRCARIVRRGVRAEGGSDLTIFGFLAEITRDGVSFVFFKGLKTEALENPRGVFVDDAESLDVAIFVDDTKGALKTFEANAFLETEGQFR